MSEPLTMLTDVDQQINQLKWSNEEKEILWVSAGNTLTMWNVNESKPKFVHAGHMSTINQIDLHPIEPRTVASVDADNDIQIFQPTRNVI